MDVYLYAVIVARLGQQLGAAVVGIGRVRSRTAQLAVTNASQTLVTVVGIVHGSEGVFCGGRNLDIVNQAVRIVIELGHASRRIGDFIDSTFLLMPGNVTPNRAIVTRIPRRSQPCKTVFHDIKAHFVVLFIRDDCPVVRIHSGRRVVVIAKLQFHALGILVGL